MTEPTSPNPAEITLPKAESAGGGGEPTEAEEAAEEAEAPARDETKLLMNALGMDDSPVKIYGWIQNSYTGNTNGVPKNAINFGVNPNYLANRWMGNQYYLIIENPLEQNDKINFGFRVDNLFGNDWVFNHMRGLAENSFPLNHFAGYDPAQIYGEVHLPILTKGGLDIKGGRFYTILGYEVVPATGRPLLSVPYMFNYGQPFTHLGMISTLHVTDRINVLQRHGQRLRPVVQRELQVELHRRLHLDLEGRQGQPGHLLHLRARTSIPGSSSRTPRSSSSATRSRPTKRAAATPATAPTGGRSFTNVFSYKWTDKLTQVIENDDSYETNIPGSGTDGTNRNDSWYGFGNWFLYKFNDKLTGVWRSEVFHDQGGQRLQTGRADTVYEMTLGLIWKPKPYIWIRPEARYDWSQFDPGLQRQHQEEPVDPRRRRDPALLSGTRPGECSNWIGPAA